MRDTWHRLLLFGVALILIGIVGGPGIRPAIRAVSAITFLVVGFRKVRRNPGRASKPWTIVLAGGALALASAAIRLVHGLIIGVDYAYPSPADIGAYLAYAVMIHGALSFVRQRTIERHRADVVDGVLVSFLAGLILYAFVLSGYVVDATVPLSHRIGNVGYSVMTVMLVGAVARVSFGPGVRNGSYYMMAAAAAFITANDVLLMLDTVGARGAFSAASIVAPMAFVVAAAAIAHPGGLLLADRPEYKDQSLTRNRIVLLLAAVATGPLLLLDASLRESSMHLTVILVLWIAIAFAVVLRLVLLVLDRERGTRQERSLRDLAATLTAVQTEPEIQDTCLEAGLDLSGGADTSYIVLYHRDELGGYEAVTVHGDTYGGTPVRVTGGDALDVLDDALESGRVVALENVAPFQGNHDVADSFIVAAPVQQRTGIERIVVATSRKLIGREQIAAFESLAGQLGLALDGVAVAEQSHQRRSNQRFRALVENSSDVVVVVNEDAKAVFVSPTVRRLLGRDEADVLNHSFMDMVHRVDQMHIRRLLATKSKVGAASASVEVRLLHGSGELRWFEVEARDLSDDEEVRGVVITASDISDRKRAEAQLLRSEARFRLLVQNTSDVVAIVDENSMLTYVSPSVENMLGFSTADVLGRNVFELLSITEAERVRPLPIAELDGSSIEVRIQGGDGQIRTVEVAITDMRDQPEVDGLVLNIRDVTERKTLEDDLRHQALHDELTGLGNRTLFADRVRDAVTNAARSAEQVAVMFVDLDDFKLINDSLGHVVGDQVLVSVAHRIQQCLRLSDVAARLGGDEFAILLSGVYGESEIIEVADRLRESLAAPITIADQTFHVTASIGIASDSSGQRSGPDLLRSADLAMYEAKEEGKNRHAIFADHMEVSAVAELELKSALVRAVENDEFVLHYQPIVDMRSRRIKGVEALIRWEDPKRGMVSPASFIPAAEESGLICEIGMWVAAEAARTLALLREQGHDIYCSINVSGRQMAEPRFAQDFIDTIRESGVDASAIVIELTESMLAVRGTSAMFEQFHDEGYRIALDDFGTGYSALQYLQTFDIDLIKIDRSFVSALGESRNSTMVRAVLDMAQSIEAETIAEGIEDSNELGLLHELGVSLGQGYYFARPGPVSQLYELLENELAPDVGAAPVP